MNPTPPQAAGSLNRFLNAIEAAGNKLPHITMLFIWALVITLVISLALSYVSFDYRHPSTGAVIAVTNMLAPANLLDLVVNSVKNFMGFPPWASRSWRRSASASPRDRASSTRFSGS